MNLLQLHLESRERLIADHSLSLRWDFEALPLPEGSLVVVTSPSTDMSLDYLRYVALENANFGRMVQCDFASEPPQLSTHKILSAIHGTTDLPRPPDFNLPGDIAFGLRDDANISLIQRDQAPDLLDELHHWARRAQILRQTTVVAFPTPAQDDWRATPDAVVNLVPSAGGIVTAWLNTKANIGDKHDFAYWYQSWLGRFVPAEEVITPTDLAKTQRDYWKEAIEHALAEELLGFIDIHRSEIFGDYLTLDFLVQSEISVVRVECETQISDVDSVLSEEIYSEVTVCVSQGTKQFCREFEGNVVALIEAPGIARIVSMEDLFEER